MRTKILSRLAAVAIACLVAPALTFLIAPPLFAGATVGFPFIVNGAGSFAAPSGSDLTLAGGDSGASIVLGRAATGAVTIAAAGTNQNVTVTPSGSGQFLFGGGSGAGPQIARAGDADTGIAWPGDNQLRFVVGAGNFMTINQTASDRLTVMGTSKVEFGDTSRATIGVSANTTAGNLLIDAPATGIAVLSNVGGGFTRLAFGGTTSAFPGLKRSGASLEVIKADDSAFGGLKVGALNGATQSLTGAGAVSPDIIATLYTSTGVGQALTLANGSTGDFKIIAHVSDGGSGILDATTSTGFSTITFTNAGDTATLFYAGATGWHILAVNGATVAP